MPPIRSDACGNFSVSLEDNVDRAHPTYRVQTWPRVTASDCPSGVPQVATDLSFDGVNLVRPPLGDITNTEF